MTLKQAAQTALDVQNACNASGVIRSLHEITTEVLWPEAQRLNLGTRWVNSHPIIAMYLFKIGELNGCGISSLDSGYEKAERECMELANAA